MAVTRKGGLIGQAVLATTTDSIATPIRYWVVGTDLRYVPESKGLTVSNLGDEPDQPTFSIIDASGDVLHRHEINRALKPGDSLTIRIEPA